MAVAGSCGRWAVLAGVLAITVLAASTPAAIAAKGFERGLTDPLFTSPNAETRALWLTRAGGAGASSVRVLASWRGIASATPPASPADPDDPSYDWEDLDTAVRDASARGLGVLMTINRAPKWAEGPNRDPDTRPGTWKPDSQKLGQFATAIATRYSGSYVDPDAGGGALPRVRDWQVWAEPNIEIHLNPQWEADKPFSPGRYKEMLNAAYDSIHAVSQTNRVVTAGTAPFGQPAAARARIYPLTFWRQVLCLKGKKLKRTKCPGGRASLDVLAHNPLSWAAAGNTSPWKSAAKLGGPDDIVVPDMHKLGKLVRKARSRGTIRPRRKAPLWVTELFWESNPPDGGGVPPATQARYLADAFYFLWRQGVSSVIWARLLDSDPLLHLNGAGGLYYADGSPKPALSAYRFPFVPDRSNGVTKAWGIAPETGKVRVQSLRGGRWRTVKRLKTGRSRIFKGSLPGRGKKRFRAVIGDQASLERKPH
jgi:hypothetical protein